MLVLLPQFDERDALSSLVLAAKLLYTVFHKNVL